MTITASRSEPLRQARADFADVIDEIGAGALYRDALTRLKAAGFGAIQVPIEFGGRGLRWTEVAQLLREVACANADVVHAMRNHLTFADECLFQHSRGLDQSRWFRRFADGEIVGTAWSAAGESPTAIRWIDGRHVVNGRTQCSAGTGFVEWVDVCGQFDGIDSYPAAATVDTRQPGVVMDGGTLHFVDALTDDVLPVELRR